MNEFTSIFKEELIDFLASRKITVCNATFNNDCRFLASFDKYLSDIPLSEKRLNESVISGWIQILRKAYTVNKTADILGYLRNFLKYLQYNGISVFMPKNPKLTQDYVPYLFSADEMKKIFSFADNLPFGSLKTKQEFPIILRMLYGCGFRIGELLDVREGDVNFQRQTVLLKNTKNKKQRIVVMSDSLSDILEQYCSAMGLSIGSDSYLFPSVKAEDKHISVSTLSSCFKRLLKNIGIYVEPELHKRGQCIHCLRHVFTVNSFAKSHRLGQEPQNAIPYLSVYLGHYDMNGTERYLKFSSDMFPEYYDAFEVYAQNTFSEVSYEE